MKFSLILANTARSQAYIQTLISQDIIPKEVFILNDKNKKKLGKITKKYINSNINNNIYSFQLATLNINEDLVRSLSKLDIPYTIINSPDINSEELYEVLLKSDTKLCIVSVYAGQILKSKILGLKKSFMHVHSGKLPEYRGSTTLYYSLLEENKVAASAIMINEGIDTGDIVYFKEFDFNFDPELIDLIFDPLLRAVVLIDAIKLLSSKNKKPIVQERIDGEDYYIIHPLLKHLAILKEKNKCM